MTVLYAVRTYCTYLQIDFNEAGERSSCHYAPCREGSGLTGVEAVLGPAHSRPTSRIHYVSLGDMDEMD